MQTFKNIGEIDIVPFNRPFIDLQIVPLIKENELFYVNKAILSIKLKRTGINSTFFMSYKLK